jgi:hypothetical protein
LNVARNSNKFTLGVFYQGRREVYHKSLYGNLNPVNNSLSREKRLQRIDEILKP